MSALTSQRFGEFVNDSLARACALVSTTDGPHKADLCLRARSVTHPYEDTRWTRCIALSRRSSEVEVFEKERAFRAQQSIWKTRVHASMSSQGFLDRLDEVRAQAGERQNFCAAGQRSSKVYPGIMSYAFWEIRSHPVAAEAPPSHFPTSLPPSPLAPRRISLLASSRGECSPLLRSRRSSASLSFSSSSLVRPLMSCEPSKGLLAVCNAVVSSSTHQRSGESRPLRGE